MKYKKQLCWSYLVLYKTTNNRRIELGYCWSFWDYVCDTIYHYTCIAAYQVLLKTNIVTKPQITLESLISFATYFIRIGKMYIEFRTVSANIRNIPLWTYPIKSVRMQTSLEKKTFFISDCWRYKVHIHLYWRIFLITSHVDNITWNFL